MTSAVIACDRLIPESAQATTTAPSATTPHHLKWFGQIYRYDDRRESRVESIGISQLSPTKQSGHHGSYSTGSIASGVSVYGFRYYSPQVGRFINRDPIDEPTFASKYTDRNFETDGIDPLRLLSNLYRFCSNDPINRYDIHGLQDVVYVGVTTVIRPPDVQSGIKSIHGGNIDIETGDVVAESFHIGVTAIPGVGNIQGLVRDHDLSASKISSCMIEVKLRLATRPFTLPVLINYDLTLRIRTKGDNKGKYWLTGGHDGYPSYEVNVSGTDIYDFHQKNIIALVGNNDITVNKSGIVSF